jgi:hypothetical protein
MTSFRLLAATVLAPMALLAACSRQSDVSLIGHWQAERMSVYSARLPVGPDIVVKEDQISNPSTGINLPIKDIERKGGEATVDFEYGLGVTFYFDGPDRLHINVPLIGKVYYRRVNDTAPTSVIQAASAPSPVPVLTTEVAKSAPPASDVTVPVVVQQPVNAAPEVVPATAQGPVEHGSAANPFSPDQPVRAADSDYQKALAAARSRQQDQALDYLNAAFRGGFRDFGRLDAAAELADLRSDVRYRALVARYR